MGLTLGFLIAGLWGFAEATLFFIVPDVFLSWLALTKGMRTALLAALLSVAGAVLGGALMVAWGATDAASARATLDMIPAISPDLLGSVQAGYADGWISDLFRGAVTGTPYKIFAVEAGALGVHPLAFLAATIPARLVRFALVILLAFTVRKIMTSQHLETCILKLWAISWISFYTFYFAVMG